MIKMVTWQQAVIIGDAKIEDDYITIKDPRILQIRETQMPGDPLKGIPPQTRGEIRLQQLIGEPSYFRVSCRAVAEQDVKNKELLNMYRESTSGLILPKPTLVGKPPLN